MSKLWHSVAFDLALTMVGMVAGSTALLSTVFYFGTIGVMARNDDRRINSLSERLTADALCENSTLFARRIGRMLADGVDSEAEVYYFVDVRQKVTAGNISALPKASGYDDSVLDREVVRDGVNTTARVRVTQIPGAGWLVVGRDKRDLLTVGDLVITAIMGGGGLTLMLAVGGAALFRRQLETRIAEIRQAAREIEAGNLSRRIPIASRPDEFTRLSDDINHMLDRIELLMDGVRHVSNTIAHHVRTPLTRIQGHLEQIQRASPHTADERSPQADAIEEIERLGVALDKLLQIAEAESGTRRQPFQPVALAAVITELLELYDAAAEAEGVTLLAALEEEAWVLGDRDLLAMMVANLIDNAFKYAGTGAVIRIGVQRLGQEVALIVEDNGPGIPRTERAKVLRRFYRLDGRAQGNGLGLSIVAAFTSLHEGTLRLEDAEPGLRVKMVLPRAPAPPAAP